MSKNRFSQGNRVGTSFLTASLSLALLWLAPAYGAEPPTADVSEAQSVDDTSATVDFRIPATAEKFQEVTVVYGRRGGGTEKDAWQNQIKLKPLTGGQERYSVTLTDMKPESSYLCRVCTTGIDGTSETWSNTIEIRTTSTPTPWYIVLGLAALVLGLLIVPFLVGGYVARLYRMPDHGWKIGLALCTLLCSIVITWAGWPPKLGIDLSGGVILVYEVDPEKKEDPTQPLPADKMNGLITAVSQRVNPGGVKEVTVRKYGVEQIEITIPKVDAAEARRIEKIVSRAGTLEFRILANTTDHAALIDRARAESGTKLFDPADPKKLEAWWVQVYIGEKPGDRDRAEMLFSYPEVAKRTVERGGRDVTEILVVKDPFDVEGGYLKQASPGIDQRGQPCVKFQFYDRGGRRFAGLTGQNGPDPVTGFTRKLGIILNGYLRTAPAIQSTIHNEGEITGSFDREEVDDIVNVLNAGSLPAALTEEPISRLQTGPTLGRDTIEKGQWAMVASMVIVLLFMLFYYRFSGIVACGALLMNVVLILAVMIMIKAAFTLPGLAGLVLTVGMAVDANVLIFERIREELARGAALRMAIRNGFGRATTTIVDANVTTLITGIVLYAIGTDQVKGFAVTLILGVTLSMYTAIFCSRIVFDIAEKRRWISHLSMMRMLGGTRIDFLGMRRVAFVASAVVIVIGLVAVVARGKGLLDIDFTGGVSVTVLFDEPQAKVADVRKALETRANLPDLAVSDVQISNEEPLKRFVINTSQPDITDDGGKVTQQAVDVVESRIQSVFGDKLASNVVTIDRIEPIEPKTRQAAPAVEEAATGPAARLDTPAKNRNDLPDDTVLALADSASVPTTSADAPEAKTAPAIEAGPSEEPAAETGPAAEGDAGKEPAAEAGPEEPTGGAPDPPATAPPAAAPQAEAPKATSEPPRADAEAGETPTGKPAVVPRDASVGGTEATLTFAHEITSETLTEMLASEFGSAESVPNVLLSSPEEGYEEGDGLPYAVWDIKMELPLEQAKPRLESLQKRESDTPFFPSSNTIGGKVAGSTRTLAITALVASLLCIVGYIWIRFQRVVFGLAAVVALVHDVLVTLGVIAITFYLAKVPGVTEVLLIDPFKIGLPALAAFLTIIGYSLNDTIVVFDRVREVRGKAPRLTPDMVNSSINQTLSRTLLTSLTTLVVVVILYTFGGQGIHGFAFALVVGVVVGTYSSVFVASPALVWMSRSSEAKQ